MDRILLFGGKPSYTCELLRNLTYSRFDCHLVCGGFDSLFSALEERDFDAFVYVAMGDSGDVPDVVCGVREKCPHINVILIVNSSFRSIYSELDALEQVEFIFLPCSMIDTVNAVRSAVLRPVHELKEKVSQRSEIENYLIELGYPKNCSGFQLLCSAVEIGLKFPQVLKSKSPRSIYSMLAVRTNQDPGKSSRNLRRFLRLMWKSSGIPPPDTQTFLSAICNNFIESSE